MAGLNFSFASDQFTFRSPSHARLIANVLISLYIITSGLSTLMKLPNLATAQSMIHP